jgi:hypothetical protein
MTISSFPHSWLITGYVTRVTRRVPHVEQVPLTLPEHLSSPMVFSVVRVAPSSVFCVVFCRLLLVLLSFFPLVIVLSARLRFAISDYSLGMFKLFLKEIKFYSIYMWSNTLFHYAVFNRPLHDCCSNINCRLNRSRKASNINFTWILTDFPK